MWMLQLQLGRRNLSEFARGEIALKYKDFIAKMAKKNQGSRNDLTSGPKEPEVKNSTDTHFTRKELAKIAGTSPTQMERIKVIKEKGSEDQIERARKGGKNNKIGVMIGVIL